MAWLTVLWLALGVVGALVFIWAARRAGPVSERRWWAVGLIVAQLIYLGFAIGEGGEEGIGWVLLEVAGLGFFGILAALGWMFSPLFTAAGWLLHPTWDYAHWGEHVVPQWLVVFCLSFDLLIGLWIAWSVLGGRERMRTWRRRSARPEAAPGPAGTAPGPVGPQRAV